MRQAATDISSITGEDKNLIMANNNEYQKLAQMQSVLLQNEKKYKTILQIKCRNGKLLIICLYLQAQELIDINKK